MIALISDIHGNYEALKEVLRKIDDMHISKIFCLGDVVGYYSQVNECCEALRNRNVECIMGNHDWYMASGRPCDRSRSVNDCLSYQRKIITKDNIDWIRSFRPIIRECNLSMVHGGWNNPIDEYLYQVEEDYFKDMDSSFFAAGHTHVQMVKEFNGVVFCNPGSVGQPRDGDNRAAFSTFDGNKFELYRVEYNYNKVGELMRNAGFNGYYYGCLRDGSKNLHE